MRAYRETDVALYRTDLQWFGILDPGDNTLIALFYKRTDADRYVAQFGYAAYQVVKIWVDE